MSEQQSEVLLAVKIWAAAAWADGVIVEAEAHGMKAVISVAKLTDDEKKTALSWLDNKVELDDVKVADIAPENRANIYAAALGVVVADNDIAADERAFLDRLRGALEIDDATAKALHDQAGL